MKGVYITIISVFLAVVIALVSWCVINREDINDIIERQRDINNMWQNYDKTIADINTLVLANHSISFAQIAEASFDENLLGSSTSDYFSSFNTEGVNVKVYKVGSMLSIVPDPDFLDSQEFHYKDGELAMYSAVSNTIGGKWNYYFYKGVYINDKYIQDEDEDASYNYYENTDDILKRSKALYEMYMKDDSRFVNL